MAGTVMKGGMGRVDIVDCGEGVEVGDYMMALMDAARNLSPSEQPILDIFCKYSRVCPIATYNCRP